MSEVSKVTIIHIFQTLSPNPSLPEVKIAQIIENNAVFLHSHNIEYIVLDQTKETTILENLNKLETYKNKSFEYYRCDFANLKESFVNGSKLATHPNIFFIFNTIEININNVFDIEKSTPLLHKQDLEFFKQNVPANFHPNNFKLYMKKNKNILDKIKLLFS